LWRLPGDARVVAGGDAAAPCDLVGVIGRGLLLRAAGWAQRPIARLLGVPRSTVRGWLDRFTARAEKIRAQVGVAGRRRETRRAVGVAAG
jgi:hypothetical protein